MFITFEGIDGAGKTTQVKALEAYLDAREIPFLSLREPGGTMIGEKIRHLLKDPKYAPLETETELFLLSASRCEILQQKVLPALEEEIWVILDRYVDSTVAYQAYGRSLDWEDVEVVNRLATQGVKPDLTFLLDIEPELARERIESRPDAQPDRIEEESLDFMRRVRQGYLALEEQEPKRFIKIDASLSIDEMTERILKIIKEWENETHLCHCP